MSVLVHREGEGRRSRALVSQLAWSVLETEEGLPARRRRDHRQIRARAREQVASLFVIHETHQARFLGLHCAPPVTIDLEPVERPRRLYALALAFRLVLETQQLEDGILVMPTSQQRCAIVGIRQGHIELDTVQDASRAQSLLAELLERHPEGPLFGELPWTLTVAEAELIPLGWEDLLSHADDSTALRRVPPSPWPWLGLAGALAVLMGGYAYREIVLRPQAQREARLQQERQDPTPRYESAATQELDTASWSRQDLTLRIDLLRGTPLLQAGWALQTIECEQRGGTGQCTFAWDRRGGTLSGFQGQAGPLTVDLEASTVDRLVARERLQTQVDPVARQRIPSLQEARSALWPVAQRLANIPGVTVALGEPRTWGGIALAGVSPQALLSTITVQAVVPLHLAGQVITALPDQVRLQGFAISLPSPETPQVTLKGLVYVH
jgi:hypothetical protein